MLVNVKRGVYGSNLIEDQTFEAVDTVLRLGRRGNYLQLINRTHENLPKKILKIYVEKNDYEIIDGAKVVDFPKGKQKGESDKAARQRIEEHFDLMEKLVQGCADRKLKGLVVSGAAGVGKSFNLQKVLESNGYENIILDRDSEEDEFDSNGSLVLRDDGLEDKKYYVLIKGRVSPLALYKTLYDHKDKIIVFDDCDSVLQENTSLNLLKAALDSYERRVICWNSRAVGHALPNKFEFTGTVIFISNIHFDSIKEGTKIKSHLDAIMSRCHFIDLGMKTAREKIIRIKSVIDKHDLFSNYDLTNKQKDEIIEFIEENQNDFREISLRTALKIADIRMMDEENWQRIAKISCLGGNLKAPALD